MYCYNVCYWYSLLFTIDIHYYWYSLLFIIISATCFQVSHYYYYHYYYYYYYYYYICKLGIIVSIWWSGKLFTAKRSTCFHKLHNNLHCVVSHLVCSLPHPRFFVFLLGYLYGTLCCLNCVQDTMRTLKRPLILTGNTFTQGIVTCGHCTYKDCLMYHTVKPMYPFISWNGFF